MVKRIVKALYNNSVSKKIIYPFLGLWLKHENASKIYKIKQQKEKVAATLFNELKVLNGPFKGLKYPSKHVERTIYSKLIGSYEKEIWPWIGEIIEAQYSEIIDVGCADGYYAVGLALNTKKTKIYAYDIDANVRSFCEEVAELNGVSERVDIESKFTPEILNAFSFGNKSLIICDTEGFERELFNESTLEKIKYCDLLIETHDFMDITISSYLKELLSSTHNIRSIYSEDDIQKAHKYEFEILKNLSLADKKLLLMEGRPAIMEWIFCKAKN